MVKVLINGCNGKMGQEVAKEIAITPEIEVLCGFDRIDTGDNNFPVFTDINDIKNKIPTVIATTGLSDEDLEKIKNYSNKFPIFRSSNMSYEINLMSKLVAQLAQKLSDSDIEIIETHHNRKIDSPSGTAIILADSINNALDNQMHYEYDRHSKREKRDKKEIGIHSIRGGNEVGKHSVIFFGNNESFEITHNVLSRAVFASGAIKAANFIIHKDNGLYDMNDMC